MQRITVGSKNDALVSLRRTLLPLLLLFISISTHAQNPIVGNIDALVHTTHTKRTLQLTPFYNKGIRDLDSLEVFRTINSIEALAKRNNDRDLVLEADLMRVHYYNYRSYFKKDFTVQKIKELDSIAKEKGILWLEIRTQSLLANYLFHNHNDYGLGFEHFERAAELLKGVSGNDYPLKQICLYQLANVYLEFREYKNAITYFLKAKDTESPLDSYYYKMNLYNSLGYSYREIKEMDSSQYYFNVTLEKALKAKDPVWEGISYGNLGINYLLKGNLKQAKPLLEKDVRIAKEQKDWGLASNGLVKLSTIALMESNVKAANDLANEAYIYAHKAKESKRFEELFPLMAKIATYKAQPELAAKYLDSAFIIKERIAKEFDGRELIRAKQRIELENQQLKEAQEKQLQSERLWIRNGIILLLILFIIIIIQTYSRYRLKTKNKEQEIIIEKQEALQKLESATKRLEDFRKSILMKNKIIESLKKNRTTAEGNSNSSPSISQQQLEETALLTDKDWREYAQLFEQVHTGFFDRLKERHPNLTASEIRFMALSRLQLGNKEMALVLGVGTPAIRQIKSRLHKKIGSLEDTTIQDLAQNI